MNQRNFYQKKFVAIQYNKLKVRNEIDRILSDPETNVYIDTSIRGIQGRVYHCEKTNIIIGIHTEGPFEGKIMKGQPISEEQLKLLEELNIID